MKRILLLLGIISSVHASEPKKVVLFPSQAVRTDRLGEPVMVGHDKDGFFVINRTETQWVQSCDVDPSLRTHLEKGVPAVDRRIHVKKFDSGQYKLESADGLDGGGQILGTLFYGATKAIIYGGIALGIGAAGNQLTRNNNNSGYRAGVGTAAAAATEMATEGASGAGTIAAAAELTGTSQSVMEGTSIVVAEGTGGATAAAASTVGGANAVIETIALQAYAVGLAIPWL